MLYELWRHTVDQQGDRWAVRELSHGKSWTFRELDDAARAANAVRGAVRFPQEVSVGFLVATIQSWRDRKVLCPLEAGQVPPVLEQLPEGCVHLKITSATTGVPRVIGFTAIQLVADVDNIASTMGLRADWPNLGVISLAHSYGFSSLVLPLLLRGIPLILGRAALPEVVRQAVEMFGPVTLPAVPTLWRAWHQAGSITRNIRLATSAGAPLPLELETDIFESTAVKIHNFYGASECGGIAYDPTDEPRSEETCGLPMRNVEVSIDEGGCLCVCSGAVGETYWPEPDPSLEGGRYVTSDLAEIRDGRIRLLGRVTDVINVAGRKVMPGIIEQALVGFAGIDACLVFGVPSVSDGHGEIIVALLATDGTPNIPELRRFLGKRLPAWQIPRAWSVVRSLDTNERGKLSRADWRRRYLAGDDGLRRLG